jgi:glutamine synthetase adenylyltransferase
MERMGHSSARAALIYLHSTDERQRKLADEVGKQAPRGAAQGQEAEGRRRRIWHESDTPQRPRLMKIVIMQGGMASDLEFHVVVLCAWRGSNPDRLLRRPYRAWT